MNPIDVVERFARGWSAVYTFGLPAEVRDRRCTEIESDLWEHQHDGAEHARSAPSSAARLAMRVVLGMAADVGWRTAERRPRRRPGVRNLAVDRTWDRRMGVAGRVAAITAIACYVPIAVDVPAVLAITAPMGALGLHQLLRRSAKGEGMADISITRQQKRRATVFAVCIAVFILGLFINSLPSQATHDDYWALFVAPSMIAFMVGVIALPMLVWSYLPRRETPQKPL